MTCTVDGCDRAPRSGINHYCEMHYYRLRRTGTTDGKPIHTQCSADGCSAQTRGRHTPWCSLHYQRLRKFGSLEAPTRKRSIDGQCTAPDCNRPMEVGTGYCRMHDLRLKHRNDLTFELKWDTHHQWTGDNASYSAVHQRLRATRGPASDQSCIDCGGQAQHWTYDHEPNEHHKVDGKNGPYSTDLTHYEPRCVSCHKCHDLRLLR